MDARKIKAGDLNRRVTLSQWQDNPDTGFATTSPHYSSPLTVWAKVAPVGLAAYHGSVQTGERVTHRIIVRRQTARVEAALLTRDVVIEYAGFRYRVRAAAEIADAREFIAIDCEQLDAVPVPVPPVDDGAAGDDGFGDDGEVMP